MALSILARTMLLLGICAAMLPTTLHAQSSVTGLVTDTTGAVLPGVTVDAASPALIELSRSAVTDSRGRYNIVDLRPGTYKVTFTLPGFTTVVREGIVLTTSFTASINTTLRVGGIEESVTVEGESPVVDVQKTVRQEVMTKDLIEGLPSGRTYQALGVLLPGTVADRPDVAGSQALQQTNLTVHGSQARDTALEVDGLSIMFAGGSGSTQGMYYDDGAFQEAAFQTEGISAETAVGGIRVNLIPKEGGNQFRAGGLLLYSNHRLNNGNITDEIRARGLSIAGSLNKLWDVNFNLGGPIKSNKLWFFTSFRNWGYYTNVPDSVDEQGQQGVDDPRIESYLGRLTWQATSRDKILLAYTTMPKEWPHRFIAAGVEPKATLHHKTPLDYLVQAKWTSVIGSRLLIEAGENFIFYRQAWTYRPDVRQPSPTAPYGDVAKVDLLNGTRRGAYLYEWFTPWQTSRFASSVSFVTGSHTLKAGVQNGSGYVGARYNVNGDSVQQYLNGVPTSVQVRNTPVNQLARLNSDLGVYVQDSWTMRRLTLNLGGRFQYLKGQIDAQDAPAGRFVPARHFDAVKNLPNWKDFAGRLGAAYDLFGNGKTAIKATAGKYLENESTSFAATYNPMTFDQDVRRWDDLNGNDIAEDNEIGQSARSTFGVRAARDPDPDIRRPYQWTYSLSVQQQLARGVAFNAGY